MAMREQQADTTKDNFFSGGFGRLVLPGVILQSVLIGGGYASGREIVQFGAKFGALGWIAGAGIFVGFVVTTFLMFEVARRFQTFDYRTLLRQLIGPLYWLFDIVYILLAILTIAVMAAATGEILQETLDLTYWAGVALMIVVVGVLNFYGEHLIEQAKTWGTAALYGGYILFATLVISNNWDRIGQTLSSGDHSLFPTVSVWAIIWSGILYVGFSMAAYPAALFTVRRQTWLRHTAIAGLVAGLLMTIPWFLTYFALMSFYPQARVLDAPVPWLEMLGGQAAWVVVVFGIVVGWTLIETATGMIYALVARVDQNLVDLDRKRVTRPAAGTIAVVALVLALILAQVGIIDLVAKGYTAMGYAMIAVFAIPLLARGTYLIVTRRGLSVSPATEPSVHARS